MFVFLFQVSLVLVAIQNEALTQQHDGHGLYGDYHEEYAAAYDNYAPRPYAFEYGVSDPHTGDHKTHWEMKDETGVVRGSYSLLESDGSTRSVDYIADHSGFRAIVKKIGNHGNVYSVENHGSVPSNSPVQTSLHGGEVDILQQQIVTEKSPLQNIPLYQSYNGEIKNYQKYTSEVEKQIPHSESYYLENPAENTYPVTDSSVDEIHEILYLEKPAETGSDVDRIREPEQSEEKQSTFSKQEIYFNPIKEYSFDEKPQYVLILPKTVETHQQQTTCQGDLYEQPLKSNIESLQYSNDINIPITMFNENAYHNIEQVGEISPDLLQQIWKRQSTFQYQLGRQPQISTKPPSYESNVVLHPHGESSQRFYGRTGNNNDDTQYTD